MKRMILSATLLTALTCMAMPAEAQNLSVAPSVLFPIGEMGKNASAGIGIAISTEQPLGHWGLGLRLDGGIDYTPAHGAIKSYQGSMIGVSLTHWASDQFYVYAGLGLYTIRTTREVTVVNPGGFTGPTTETAARAVSSLGAQGGVGYNLNSPRNVFIEIGLVDAFTPGTASMWFPIKFGYRF